MTAPERIFAWSKETTDRDNRPVTETGWEDDDYDAKWYADWGTPLSSYTRTDLIQPMIDKAVAEANARADRAEAALAAQIEVDALVCDELAAACAMALALAANDTPEVRTAVAYSIKIAKRCAATIRAQPHDRSAIARVKGGE